MFKVEFYDSLTKHMFSSWWIYLLLGLNFIALAILIYVFPELIAWLIATFLLANGLLFLGISFNVWRIKKRYHGWKTKHKIPVK